jgi:hypothetical protein
MVFLLEEKHSKSTPGLQERTSPLLEPTGATWHRRKKPRAFRIEMTWGEFLFQKERGYQDCFPD